MINIGFTADALPSDFSGTLQDFQSRFLLNLHGHIADTQVLAGQIGGAQPTTNVGPWLNNDVWYVWNGAEYVPTSVKVGGAGYTVQLSSPTTVGTGLSTTLSSNVQTLQDKSGTVALLDDVYTGRAVTVLTGTTPTIDWSQGHNFFELLTGNTTIKVANSIDGQKIVVALRNSGTSYTVTWPSSIFWTGGSAPTQTASKTDLYVLRNIGGSIFGKQTANY
jgi:hypothetical protein